MPYTRHVKLFPSMDKAFNARELAEKHVRENPLNGRTSLSQIIVGKLPALHILTLFDDIEALEKNRDALWSDSDFLEFQSQLNPLLREPTELTITESVVQTSGPANPSNRYSHQARFFPNGGDIEEASSMLKEFAEGQHAAGRTSFRMGRVVFSPSGSVFTLGDSYESLTEFENIQKTRGAQARELQKRLAPLTRTPMEQELRQIIVPLNG